MCGTLEKIRASVIGDQDERDDADKVGQNCNRNNRSEKQNGEWVVTKYLPFN